MTPTGNKPKEGLLIIAGPKGVGDEPRLKSPESDEPDEDDMLGGDASASCASCYAYQPSTGRCLRFPPHGMEWAQVDESDYCCEYKKGPQHESGGGQEQPSAEDALRNVFGGQPGGGLENDAPSKIPTLVR